MAVLAWWVIPVTVALIVGAIIRLWGRRPRFGRSFEEVEHFHRFLSALKRRGRRSPRRGGRSTA
jgi:hypothetical protein